MARTPQREHLFKWVGPVYTTKLGLISKKKRNIHLETLEDTKELTISTFIDSTMDNILLAKGVPNDRLVRKQRVSEAMDLLITDKVDLLAYTLTPTLYSLQLKGIDPTDYEMALEMRTVDLYIAFNKTTEDALINKLQTAFETMKKPNSDGESPYDRIISHYFLPKM